MPSREPSCLGCAKREREIKRLRIVGRADLEQINELESDKRALRRAVIRLQQKLDALEDEAAD